MTRYHRIGYIDEDGKPAQKRVEFTVEEERAWDVEEAAWEVEKAAQVVLTERQKVLTDKLFDDTITEAEIRELMRLERGGQ
jgi:hypothetical protein